MKTAVKCKGFIRSGIEDWPFENRLKVCGEPYKTYMAYCFCKMRLEPLLLNKAL